MSAKPGARVASFAYLLGAKVVGFSATPDPAVADRVVLELADGRRFYLVAEMGGLAGKVNST